MNYFKLALSAVVVILVFYALNFKHGSIPPIGSFLSPSQGIWQNAHDEVTDGSLAITNLSEPVTVHYDEHLIPHIFAQNDSDLYRAQGYITAKHRLWQLDFQTYAAAGRISEIIGKDAISFDREARRRGMVFGAENALKKMQEDKETLSYMEAYRDGVNTYINSLDPEDFPIEYKLLDYQPEPWTTAKTALLLMYMTKMLSMGDSDLEYTNALRLFGKEKFDILYPDFFDKTDPVIPSETDWNYIDVEPAKTTKIETPMDTISQQMEKPHPDNGSNNWAVSAEKSVTGNAILANDPHLGLNLPSIWFVMQLSTPEHNAFGATLPGALGIISGFNNHIAWGETNATRDVVDWYKIEFKDDERNEYKYGDEWRETTKKIEQIKVRGQETMMDTVVYTHYGPVSFDRNYKMDDPKNGYAMKWVGHIGGNNQRPFLALNKAKNYDDYVNALKTYTAPAQNFVFASTSGDIALWIQGLFPNKWEGQGKFLMDGSDPRNEWQGFIPQQFNAHVKNPDRGFVSSANQHPVDSLYPYYVFNDGYETYRNRVINDFFKSKEKFSIQDFKDLQNNNYNLKAADLLPTMLKRMDVSGLNSEEKEVLEQIKSWDFNSDIDQVGPSIWLKWWGNLFDLTWDEFERDDLILETPFSYQTIYLLINHPEDELMDVQETEMKETADDLFLISFKQTVENLKNWKSEHGDYTYGKYKATRAGHLLQALPAFSRFNIPIGGGSNIVNATSSTHGPSWRMIVEMSSPPKALGIYPGGQSGNPGSRYYDDMIDRWAAGDYIELNFMQDANQTEGIIATQTLNPRK